MNDPKIKQQIADKIKNTSNILVTVSNDPSVDELSAALGLALLLNSIDKHATAIFSGQTPPAITFLDPEKTFEGTTDSLRDFIIALDKEKADHLRYKLEGDLVKIYITPYRNTISSEDLEFSQGDYNVELVIALGVENRDHLDNALAGHGKILHDATVVTLTAGEQTSNLGSLDWHDSNASSLSEMLVSLYETMKLDKKVLNKAIATAWLTGIVAATERFSNTRTTSRVMTLAANLMAAGADQQLIAARLEEASELEAAEEVAAPEMVDGKASLTEGERTKVGREDATTKAEPEETDEPRPDGELVISHAKTGTLDEVAKEVDSQRLEAAARAAERALEKHEEATTPNEVAPAETPLVEAARGPVAYAPEQPPVVTEPAPEKLEGQPTFGGTLNATSEQAEEEKRRQIEDDKNKKILTRSFIGNQQPTYDSPINSVGSDGGAPSDGLFSSTPSLEPSAEIIPSAPTAVAPTITPPSEVSAAEPPAPALPPVYTPEPAPAPELPPVAPLTGPTLADLDAQHRTQSDDARAAVEAALAASAPAEPAPAPAADQPMMPTVGELPPPPNPMPMPPGDMGGLPLPPPLPTDFSASLPPVTPEQRLGDILPPADPLPPAAPVGPTDPGQFRIPGQ